MTDKLKCDYCHKVITDIIKHREVYDKENEEIYFFCNEKERENFMVIWKMLQ